MGVARDRVRTKIHDSPEEPEDPALALNKTFQYDPDYVDSRAPLKHLKEVF